jgi:excisionase family DNA binding protein
MMCANAQTTAATTDVPSGSTSTAYVPFADLPDVLTTEQAAAALQVDCKTVRSMVRRGELRGVRCGRLIRIPKAALVAFCGGE